MPVFRSARIRFYFRVALGLLPMAALLVGGINWWMVRRMRPRIFTNLTALPVNEVAIVLGTSPTGRGGHPNPFFEGRMEAAAALYHAGKVRHLLLSGDNGTREYDEPAAMRAALVNRGVPASAMVVDDAGFRTLDTMARASRVFGLKKATVVTDDFHEARALFLARHFGVEAIGYPSPPVPFDRSKKTRLRELASRFVAWMEVQIRHDRPRFYGPRETISQAEA